MTPTEAAKAITRHRERLGWSKRRLARESGISAPYIVQLENGARPVNPQVLAEIADAVGVHPYVLLGEAGFIASDHVAEAERMAAEAIKDPEVAGRARTSDTGGAFAWIVSDYLYLLGDDPYGTGWEYGPGGHELDWTPYAPERVAAADDNPQTEDIRRLRFPSRYPAARPAPTEIEGWNELTNSDQRLVQQLVNRLRRQEPAK